MANVVTIFGDLNRLMKLTPNITYDNLMIILHVSRMTILRDINLLRSRNKLKREGVRKGGAVVPNPVSTWTAARIAILSFSRSACTTHDGSFHSCPKTFVEEKVCIWVNL